MKLDFAAQLGTVRFLGTFPSDDPIGVPTVVVDYVAELLGIADPSCIKAYTKRPKTAYEHAREIQRTLATAASPGGGGAGRLGGPRGRGTAARPKALFVHWG